MPLPDLALVDIRPTQVRLMSADDDYVCSAWMNKYGETPSDVAGRHGCQVLAQYLLHAQVCNHRPHPSLRLRVPLRSGQNAPSSSLLSYRRASSRPGRTPVSTLDPTSKRAASTRNRLRMIQPVARLVRQTIRILAWVGFQL